MCDARANVCATLSTGRCTRTCAESLTHRSAPKRSVTYVKYKLCTCMLATYYKVIAGCRTANPHFAAYGNQSFAGRCNICAVVFRFPELPAFRTYRTVCAQHLWGNETSFGWARFSSGIRCNGTVLFEGRLLNCVQIVFEISTVHIGQRRDLADCSQARWDYGYAQLKYTMPNCWLGILHACRPDKRDFQFPQDGAVLWLFFYHMLMFNQMGCLR